MLNSALHKTTYIILSDYKQERKIVVHVVVSLATTVEGVLGSEPFSQFWKNNVVFSNTVVLYIGWCLTN
jgi:hypothetical protein